MVVQGTVAGLEPGTEDAKEPKEKVLEVETEGRRVIIAVGKESISLDRHTVPTATQLLNAAFLEIS